MSAPKIFCFINSGRGSDWQHVMALSEDGHVLAGHVSSHEDWAKHDIGITSDWKHDRYRKHYPGGFELVWVDDPMPGKHAELDDAAAKHLAQMNAEATP